VLLLAHEASGALLCERDKPKHLWSSECSGD